MNVKYALIRYGQPSTKSFASPSHYDVLVCANDSISSYYYNTFEEARRCYEAIKHNEVKGWKYDIVALVVVPKEKYA